MTDCEGGNFMAVRKFIKKPIEVEAFQFGVDETPEWALKKIIRYDYSRACIETLEGDMWFCVGDYVIKGVANECYPCKREIFEETYTEIKD